ALRKAAKASSDLEVRRRIELVVMRIENALFKTEEKLWQNMDAPRHGIKDRLVKILARTPALSDHQVTSAVYLLTVGLSPTDEHVARAKKQFSQSNGRLTNILQLTSSLVPSEKFRASVS